MKMLIAALFFNLISLGNIYSQELLTFKDVRPILENRCVGCHADASATTSNLNWSDYKTVYEMRDEIYLKVVTLRNMPMYTKMPNEERAVIKLWIDQGAHE